jgi:hypothetical protein
VCPTHTGAIGAGSSLAATASGDVGCLVFDYRSTMVTFEVETSGMMCALRSRRVVVAVTFTCVHLLFITVADTVADYCRGMKEACE